MAMYAITFFHELCHLLCAERDGRLFKPSDSRSVAEKMREEVAIWSAECRLVLTLGSHAYRKAASKCADAIWRQWYGKGSDVSYKGRGTALDFIFGKPKEFHIGSRDFLFYQYCSFMAAERFPDPNIVQSRKAKILSSSPGYSLRGYAEKEQLRNKFPLSITQKKND